MTALLFSISLKGFFFFFGKIEVWVFLLFIYRYDSSFETDVMISPQNNYSNNFCNRLVE